MVKFEVKQKMRKAILDTLTDMRHDAYSGLTCVEYDAINVLIHFIKMKYMEDEAIKEEDNG